MNNTFEPTDRRSWYFGRISRQDATDLLMAEKDGGSFLVRDSLSIPGDYVLCVKEDCKVCHYIINKVEEDDGTTITIRYKIGDRFFSDLPALLAFYRLHYLDTTPLIRPATRKIEKVIAKHDFEGNDPEDLPFRKGDVLTVISKDEEQWWAARNNLGRVGAIPVPYVKPYDESLAENNLNSAANNINQAAGGLELSSSIPSSSGSQQQEHQPQQQQRKIDATKIQYARVKQARVPNAYDDTALKLQIGDIIRVTKINMSGQWEGELILPGGQTGRKGHFPFTHVEYPIAFETKEAKEGEEARNSQDGQQNQDESSVNGLNVGVMGLTIKTT